MGAQKGDSVDGWGFWGMGRGLRGGGGGGGTLCKDSDATHAQPLSHQGLLA